MVIFIDNGHDYRVQTLDEAVSILHNVDILEKCVHPIISLQKDNSKSKSVKLFLKELPLGGGVGYIYVLADRSRGRLEASLFNSYNTKV